MAKRLERTCPSDYRQAAKKTAEHERNLLAMREKLRPTFGDRVDDPKFDPTDPYDTVPPWYKSLRPKNAIRRMNWMYNPELEDKERKELITGQQAVKHVARRMTDMAMNALKRTLENTKSDSVRLKAIEMILERGWGKPTVETQAVQKPDTKIEVVWGDAKGNRAGVQITQDQTNSSRRNELEQADYTAEDHDEKD